MAKSVEIIEDFEMKICDRVKQVYINDIKRLEKKYDVKIMPWNVSYYVEKDKSEECAFNIMEFKKYFEVERFLGSFMEVLQTLYGVKIEKLEVPTWHSDVRPFSITRNEKQLGTLYMDLVQREGKRPGAWFNRLGPKTFIICCNFSPKPDQGEH